MEQLLPLDSVVVGDRCRRDLGDIDSLAASIRERQLLQPLVVTDGNVLVAGYRRLQAVRQLGWESVPVRVIAGIDDAMSLLQAERDENTQRKYFTPLEMVDMGRRLEALEKPKAKQRQQQHGKTAPGRSKDTSGNLPELSDGQTRDKVAEALGVGARTYEKAKAVAEAAEQDPEQFGDLAEAMEKSGKVDPAYRKLQERRNPVPPPPPPKHPHSDRLVRWLEAVASETHVINVEMGGIGTLLKNRKAWSPRDVREFILPMLEALATTIEEFRKEISKHAPQ